MTLQDFLFGAGMIWIWSAYVFETQPVVIE
jgi:hypothetical protein